jgi:hypothetical protein
MTATTAPQVPRTRSGPHAGPARTALAVVMPAGPLAIAVVRAILPYNTTDSNTAMAAKVAAHQGTQAIVIWLTFVALLTLIPGVITVGLLARRLGTAGLVLAYAAFACLFWSSVAGSDNVALGAACIGMHPGATGALLTSIANIPPSGSVPPSSSSVTSSASCCSASRCGADAPCPPGFPDAGTVADAVAVRGGGGSRMWPFTRPNASKASSTRSSRRRAA